MTAEVAMISSGRLSAGISPHGAELHYLTDSHGNDLQWDGNPAFWTGRAPILFPIIGQLHHDHYDLDGMRYPMPKHGFARHALFDVVERSDDAVTFRLSASSATLEIYPFAFQLDVRFSVHDAALTVTAAIANHGDTIMPASFGFHPALRWPLPFGQARAEHAIRFASPEPAPIRRIDADGFLLPQPQPTPVVGNLLTLSDELFVDDVLIFDRLESRRLSYGAPTGPRLTVEFTDFPTLGVWTKPGAGFVCIEPWQGFSDPVGYTGDIRQKPGIIEIEPGAIRHFTMRIGVAA